MKKRFLIFLAILAISAGCYGNGVKLIWDTAGEPADIKTPKGFDISPLEAYTHVRGQRILSLKHIWHIYADDKNYYIIDSFFGSNPGKALKTGVIIDGKTGLRNYR